MAKPGDAPTEPHPIGRPPAGRVRVSAEWAVTVESMYRAHFDGLCRCARRMLDTQHASEEVVQEAFVRFATLRERPRMGRELSYLRSIVLNEARSTLRHRKVTTSCRVAVVDVSQADATGDAVLRGADAQSLRHHVAELPTRQRQVVMLRHLEGLSARETAELLNISTGSVKTHTSRALRSIRAKVLAA